MATKLMTRSKVFVLVLAVAMFFVAVAGFSQEKTLAVGSAKPIVDGVVEAGEYALKNDYGSMQLYLSRSPDTLYVGTVGLTQGWVAVGLNSLKMDGASIFMGAVGEDGSVRFSPQTGSDHRHSDMKAETVSDSVVSYAVTETDGSTTLEIALKAGSYIMDGQNSLDMIFAIGPADTFYASHVFRGSQKVALAQ
jgi:hypothetical protein